MIEVASIGHITDPDLLANAEQVFSSQLDQGRSYAVSINREGVVYCSSKLVISTSRIWFNFLPASWTLDEFIQNLRDSIAQYIIEESDNTTALLLPKLRHVVRVLNNYNEIRPGVDTWVPNHITSRVAWFDRLLQVAESLIPLLEASQQVPPLPAAAQPPM